MQPTEPDKLATGEVWDVPDSVYYSDAEDSVSHSELEVFRDSPALYSGRFLDRKWPTETSPAMEFGKTVHRMILETADDAADWFAVIPPEVLSSSGSRAGAAWKEWSASKAGMVLLKTDEFNLIQSISKALFQNQAAHSLLYELTGRNEFAIRFDCQITGLVRRSKLDRLCYGKAIMDIKVVADASAKSFSRQIVEFGYHRQASFYQDAAQAVWGARLPFVFLAVQKSPPFTVNAFELDEQFLAMGAEENESDLRRFAEAKRLGVWKAETDGTIVTLSAPRWAQYEHEWSV